jgi:hypothetical protein
MAQCKKCDDVNDEGLGPDLSRGRGKSIGGDLDVGEEGFG